MIPAVDRLAPRGGVADTLVFRGRVVRISGMIIEAILPRALMGATCRIAVDGDPNGLMAEIVALRDGEALMMPLGPLRGVRAGAEVELVRSASSVAVGRACLGRVLDALGRPIDGGPALSARATGALYAPAPRALSRAPVTRPLDTGVRVVNALLTMAHGQRIAIAAGAGVGKSTLLGMMARGAEVDLVVVALIGERGREVQEFVAEEITGHEGASDRVVVVAATSDEPPSMRLRAAYTATAIAEYFRDVEGLDVLLLMDSLSRVAMAQREVGLSAGEVPAARGYPPSAFALIPGLLERAGTAKRGSMTAVYTTLFEAGDEVDPISDAVRGTTDGHIVLSRDRAERGIYPAVDAAESVSRVMRQVTSPAHQERAVAYRATLRDYDEARELANLGAYQRGSNPAFDRALEIGPGLIEFARQAPDEKITLADSIAGLGEALEPRPAPKPALGAAAGAPSAKSQARAYAAHEKERAAPAPR